MCTRSHHWRGGESLVTFALFVTHQASLQSNSTNIQPAHSIKIILPLQSTIHMSNYSCSRVVAVALHAQLALLHHSIRR